jgi:uncharacterized protein YcaQ
VTPLALTLDRARRLTVIGQLLSAPRPTTIDAVVHGLGEVQMDPTSAVARTEHLVLWSRLGSRFRVADLERMLWQDRSLFEYRAHIVPTADFDVHREEMRRRRAETDRPVDTIAVAGRPKVRHRYTRDWLAANVSFRRYVLRELRLRGPLRTRDLEDRTTEGWRTGGWNDDGRFTGMMLEILWGRGEVMIVGRDGQQRLWDLIERSLPVDEPRRSQREVARRIVERQLRARGVARTNQFGFAFDGRPPGWERALRELVRDGVAIPATVRDLAGDWYVHADVLERAFRPRTTLLSPFDDLVSNRDHTEQLFGFRFRLEIYVPKAKREFGYFVLPILHGDRLIGRIDPRFDRATRVLHINAVYAEDGAPTSAGSGIRRSVEALGAWLGAGDIRIAGKMPSVWRSALT